MFWDLSCLPICKLKAENKQMEDDGKTKKKSSSLRWGILRDAFLSRSISSQPPDISRKPKPGGFNLIPSNRIINDDLDDDDVCVSYTLPLIGSPTLVLRQRIENAVNLKDLVICNEYNIDNTGLVGHWPSEEVLAYYCMAHSDMFRSKRVLELGAGYGLAGLVIAAATDASEVIISDGNPQVVDYIQRNIDANSQSFSETRVKAMILHWNNQDILSDSSNLFDIIVASDCTFFKDFHEGLARTLKYLLKKSEDSEAIFLCPKRGNTLDKFVEKITEVGLHFCMTENYDKKVWEHHQRFLNDGESWRNYETEHCYPLLIRITL